MKYFALAVSLFLMGHGIASAQNAQDRSRVVVYNAISDDPSADRAARNAYTGKYRVIDIKTGDGFSPARLKGRSPYPRDPRSMRELATPAKAVVVYLVTPEGSVIEPRIVKSTDQRVANYLIKSIMPQRYVPAKFRGAPVFSINVTEVTFGNSIEQRPVNDGLGLQGFRYPDR